MSDATPLSNSHRRYLKELRRGKRSKITGSYLFRRYYLPYVLKNFFLTLLILCAVWFFIPTTWTIPLNVVASALVLSVYTCWVANVLLGWNQGRDYSSILHQVIDWQRVDELLDRDHAYN